MNELYNAKGDCMNILKIISDVIIIISTVLLINNFGISKIKKRIYQFSSILCSVFLSIIMTLSHLYNFNIISIFLYPLMFVLSFYICFGEIKVAQIYLALIIEFLVTLLSSCLAVFILQLSSISYMDVDTISTLFLRITVFIVSVSTIFRKKYLLLYPIAKKIPKHIFILILLSLICTTFLSACNNLPVSNIIKQNFITILIALLSIFVIIVIISLLINVASKNYYTALNSLLENQVTTQINHYEKLEKLNNDIRTFRHDYINHLSSINTLIEEGCYSDAQRYIDKLTESTHRHESVFITGNRLADAILTDKSDNCKDFADIDFEGCITDKIDNSDICIILANALDNAVEACRKCSGRSKISIAAQVRQCELPE